MSVECGGGVLDIDRGNTASSKRAGLGRSRCEAISGLSEDATDAASSWRLFAMEVGFKRGHRGSTATSDSGMVRSSRAWRRMQRHKRRSVEGSTARRHGKHVDVCGTVKCLYRTAYSRRGEGMRGVSA